MFSVPPISRAGAKPLPQHLRSCGIPMALGTLTPGDLKRKAYSSFFGGVNKTEKNGNMGNKKKKSRKIQEKQDPEEKQAAILDRSDDLGFDVAEF